MLAGFDLKPPPPYQVVKRNYQNLGALNHPFLAVPNLLLSHPYKAGGTYFKRVATLQRCLGSTWTNSRRAASTRRGRRSRT